MERNKDSALITGASSASVRWTRLRIEASDGSHGMEYRIEGGRVESRNLDLRPQPGESVDIGWQRLTPEQLAAHVLEGTALAKWLSRRMGVEALLRACTRTSSATTGTTPDWPRTRGVVIGEFSPLPTKTSDSGTEWITSV